jgi:hypothetical protein
MKAGKIQEHQGSAHIALKMQSVMGWLVGFGLIAATVILIAQGLPKMDFGSAVLRPDKSEAFDVFEDIEKSLMDANAEPGRNIPLIFAANDATATVPARDPAAEGACALSAGPDTPRWAPPQARNASTRVFMTSASAIDVCVTDAAGVSTPLRLKPGAMVSASGKPPYIVRSDRLSQAQIFLQGLKVRVPASAVAVHLITTSSVRSPEAPVPVEQ